jgi:hypothetical protein
LCKSKTSWKIVPIATNNENHVTIKSVEKTGVCGVIDSGRSADLHVKAHDGTTSQPAVGPHVPCSSLTFIV